jgi:hypothetical protein
MGRGEGENMRSRMRPQKGKNGLIALCHYLGDYCSYQALVEIGSFTGEAAQIFSKFFKHVICVDLWSEQSIGTTNTRLTAQEVEKIFDDNKPENVVKIKGESTYVAKALQENFEVVYIDGSHDYESVKNDIKAWRPKAKILCGHDYNFVGVKLAVDELLGKPDMVFIDNSWIKI